MPVVIWWCHWSRQCEKSWQVFNPSFLDLLIHACQEVASGSHTKPFQPWAAHNTSMGKNNSWASKWIPAQSARLLFLWWNNGDDVHMIWIQPITTNTCNLQQVKSTMNKVWAGGECRIEVYYVAGNFCGKTHDVWCNGWTPSFFFGDWINHMLIYVTHHITSQEHYI